MGDLQIGVDLGPALQAGERADLAAATGAGVARVHVGLEGHAEPDAAFLDGLTESLGRLAAAGLDVVAVADTDLTVAPTGLGALADPPVGPLHEAWTEEWLRNVRRVAQRADGVRHWELLPRPNLSVEGGWRIAPGTWIHHVGLGREIVGSAAPGAQTIAGGLIVRQQGQAAAAFALEAARAYDGEAVDAVAIELQVDPDGELDEGALVADVTAAARRVAEATTALSGGAARLAVTHVSWDAATCGTAVQARNLWATFNALSALDPVAMLLWGALVDDGAETGLVASASDEGARREAWHAFNDFVTYAAQIAPPAYDLFADAHRDAGHDEEVLAGDLPAAVVIPTAEDVLRAQGISGPRLTAALAALEARHGDLAALTPGRYETAPPQPPITGGATNQDVLSAFYRVGEGTWSVLERAGLELADLATNRSAAYRGPPIESLTGLSEAERDALVDAMASARTDSA